MAITVAIIPGTKETQYRGIAFLAWPEDPNITAAASLKRLEKASTNEKGKVWARFDHWIDGHPKPNWYHGWDEDGFKHCFVFKWNKGGSMQRLYGFLTHPKPLTNRRFQLCVLFSHVVKVGKSTDPAQKKKAEALFANRDVMVAVGRAYPDE
jgi:hypothetical protein